MTRGKNRSRRPAFVAIKTGVLVLALSGCGPMQEKIGLAEKANSKKKAPNGGVESETTHNPPQPIEPSEIPAPAIGKPGIATEISTNPPVPTLNQGLLDVTMDGTELGDKVTIRIVNRSERAAEKGNGSVRYSWEKEFTLTAGIQELRLNIADHVKVGEEFQLRIRGVDKEIVPAEAKVSEGEALKIGKLTYRSLYTVNPAPPQDAE